MTFEVKFGEGALSIEIKIGMKLKIGTKGGGGIQ